VSRRWVVGASLAGLVGAVAAALGQDVRPHAWLLEHDGVVYQFYCAVGTEGRAIALATSREIS
jgi:hypothetical protein